MSDLVLNVLRRQKEELGQLLKKKTVPRFKQKELKTALSDSLIKVILGPRRAGKSTLALQALADKRFAYLNFEDESFPPQTDGDEILKAMDSVYGDVEYYLFDEIQILERWEQFLNRAQRLGKNIVVTGSNAHLLSTELATSLTGRYRTIELLPFSFAEAAQAEENSLEQFRQYLVQGGFPEAVLGMTDYKSYLSTLWEAIILKDIVSRHRIRNTAALRETLSLFLSSLASRFNSESLTRALNKQISAPSVKKFIHYGQEAYLIAELPPYHVKPRQRLKADRKAYTVDNGFFSARHIGVLDDGGKLLENLVFVELWRRGFRPGLDLFYYCTGEGYEVDFLLRDGHLNRELVQVSFSLGSHRTREREYRALFLAAKELQVNELTVVTLNEEHTEKHNSQKISVVPAWKWCKVG